MQHLCIGNLQLSKNILGTTYFGTQIDQPHAFELLDCFKKWGGNTIDTARSYANWLPNGESASETVIGNWLEARACRKEMIISTKCAMPTKQATSRLSREEIFSDVQESLACLKTSYVDVLFLHRDDETIPVAYIMPVLHDLVRAGTVRYLGASNWRCERIEEANAYAEKHGLTPFSVSQIQWSAAVATPESMQDTTLVCMNEREYAWYLEHRFPVMAFSPQAKGIFSKFIEQGEDSLNDKIRTRFLTEQNRKRVEWVRAYCKKQKISPAAAILSYIQCNAVPAACVLGCSNPQQLADSMLSVKHHMSNTDIQILSQMD